MCSLATLQNVMDKTTLERKILANSVQMLLQEHSREKSALLDGIQVPTEDDGESFLCTDEATDAICDVVHQYYVMCSQINQLLLPESGRESAAHRTRKTLNSQETQKKVERVRKGIESAVHCINDTDTEFALQIFDPKAERSATKDRIIYQYLHSRQQRALLR